MSNSVVNKVVKERWPTSATMPRAVKTRSPAFPFQCSRTPTSSTSFSFSCSPSCSCLPEACLRIVDVRGIMGRACAKQWGAHVQSNGLHMCKAMACAWRWLYLLANTSAPLKDQSLMLSLSCMDMVSPDKLSRLLLSMKPVQLNNLSASVLVAKTQRYFLASLHRLGNCGLLGLNRSKGSSPSSRAFSERSCLLLLC